MSYEYNQFKTPFYEIEVSDPSHKRKVTLPHHILRLIEKIEITEAYVSPENQFGATTAVISFIEGSREPASQDPSLGTSGLYQLGTGGQNVDMDISGSITNRVGSIVDLRFSGNGGITFLTSEEKVKGAVDDRPQENVQGKIVTRKHKKEAKAPKFLFDSYNLIKITWGYKEDISSVRSILLSIISIETVFSDTGPTTINIQLSDKAPLLNQIVPKDAVAFGEVIPVNNNAVINFRDLKTEDLIRKIAEQSGMAAIISKNILSDSLDKNKQKMWIAGESFHEFLSKLASTQNCYYKIINNPKDGKPTIYFIKREDFEAKTPLRADKYFYLEYKHPGSLIKSVSVNADFAIINGYATKGLTDEAETISDDSDVSLQQFKDKEGQILVNPNLDPAVNGITNGLLGGNYTGKLEITPNQNIDYHKGKSATNADKQSRLIQIDLVTLGYSKFTPGVFNISNIGVRYSGKYRMLNVSHIIDNSGYICRMNGTTHSLTSGGTKIPDAISAKDNEKYVGIHQFKSKDGTINPNTDKDGVIRDQLDAEQGTK